VKNDFIDSPRINRNHVAQHVTLVEDCDGPQGVNCSSAGCQQIYLSRDGGRTYTVEMNVSGGTSGNFNGYGGLGTAVPLEGLPPTYFATIVGCNNCKGPGMFLSGPTYLQTWADDSATGLRVVKNETCSFRGISLGR
jgi:hypothetical protein